MSEIVDFLKINGFSEDEAVKTFKRFYSYLVTMCQKKDVKEHFKAIEESEYDQLIIVKDIDVNLMCPHHLLPVIMKVHISYVPNGKILGLSKFARVSRDLAKPITQEEYTDELVKIIQENLKPEFVMAIVEGEHTCMRARGVQSINSKTITNAIRHDEKITVNDVKSYKQEFMKVVLNG